MGVFILHYSGSYLFRWFEEIEYTQMTLGCIRWTVCSNLMGVSNYVVGVL